MILHRQVYVWTARSCHLLLKAQPLEQCWHPTVLFPAAYPIAPQKKSKVTKEQSEDVINWVIPIKYALQNKQTNKKISDKF